jgi:hypothetical protein
VEELGLMFATTAASKDELNAGYEHAQRENSATDLRYANAEIFKIRRKAMPGDADTCDKEAEKQYVESPGIESFAHHIKILA